MASELEKRERLFTGCPPSRAPLEPTPTPISHCPEAEVSGLIDFDARESVARYFTDYGWTSSRSSILGVPEPTLRLKCVMERLSRSPPSTHDLTPNTIFIALEQNSAAQTKSTLLNHHATHSQPAPLDTTQSIIRQRP